MRLGLYKGYDVEPYVRQRYFARLESVMLKPTADNLTRSLYLLSSIKIYQRNAPTLTTVTGIDSVEPRALLWITARSQLRPLARPRWTPT